MQLKQLFRLNPEFEVSIPVGFFQALQRRCGRSETDSRRGFNPCRVFSGLATDGRWKSRSPPVSFNPCRVFSGLATSYDPSKRTRPLKFQSLSGFFRPCNRGTATAEIGIAVLFQSLSGFFRPCNPDIDLLTVVQRDEFQSLSGFFRPCNSAALHPVFTPATVFQSLSGFFRPCNTRSSRRRCRQLLSFNPCRVFSGLATSAILGSIASTPRFQSLSGFFRPCNLLKGGYL